MGTTLGRILGRTLGTTVGGTQHTARSLVDLSWATNPVPGSSAGWVKRSLGLLGCFDVRATDVRATRGTLPLVHMGRIAGGVPGRPGGHPAVVAGVSAFPTISVIVGLPPTCRFAHPDGSQEARCPAERVGAPCRPGVDLRPHRGRHDLRSSARAHHERWPEACWSGPNGLSESRRAGGRRAQEVRARAAKLKGGMRSPAPPPVARYEVAAPSMLIRMPA
jgi:hypothetical protein